VSPLDRVPAGLLARLAAGSRWRLCASMCAAWRAARVAAAHARRQRAWREVRAAHRALRAATRGQL